MDPCLGCPAAPPASRLLLRPAAQTAAATACASRGECLSGRTSRQQFAAAAAALETELTLPGVAQSVVLTRTSGRASKMPKEETLENFAKTGATLAIHLSIQVLEDVVEQVTPHFGPKCPCAVIFRATWPEQKIFRGTLETIINAVDPDIERTALILVGNAIGSENFENSRLYAEDYDRRYRPAYARSFIGSEKTQGFINIGP